MSEQTPEQVDRRELIRLIDMGIQVEAFINSDLGRYLLDRSNAEQKAALEQLGSVDPDDPKAIRRLQFNLQVAAGIQNWLADLVVEGRNAEETLRAVEQAN